MLESEDFIDDDYEYYVMDKKICFFQTNFTKVNVYFNLPDTAFVSAFLEELDNYLRSKLKGTLETVRSFTHRQQPRKYLELNLSLNKKSNSGTTFIIMAGAPARNFERLLDELIDTFVLFNVDKFIQVVTFILIWAHYRGILSDSNPHHMPQRAVILLVIAFF
jgi:hypothetical protein